MRNLYITEEQFRKIVKDSLIKEGVEYYKTDNNGIGMHINTKQDDKSNTKIDTRLFGKSKHILNGDGTNKMSDSLSDKYMRANTNIMIFQSILDFVNNDFTGEIEYDENGKMKQKVLNMKNEFESNGEDPKEGIKDWIDFSLSRFKQTTTMFGDKYARASKSKSNTKIPRYNLGILPGTDIQVIALFLMDDFNFSDALKHGHVRQTRKTDELLGINSSDREKETKNYGIGRKELKKIPLTYDDDITPDIANNFSLDDKTLQGGEHFKKNYDYKSKDYTSINQFLDKSIMGACYALKKINYIPNVIVSAPSSSRFNEYYCTNLSRKLNIPYIKDFFKRNLINVVYDKQTEDSLNKVGATEEDKQNIKRLIINSVYAEIAEEFKKPIVNFVHENEKYLLNISKEQFSREKIDAGVIIESLANQICEDLKMNALNTQPKNLVYKSIVRNIVSGIKRKSSLYNNNRIYIESEIGKRIKLNIGQKVFIKLLEKCDSILEKYKDKIDNGFNVNTSKFKIIKIEKRFRSCLRNVYIVSDKYLSNSGNELQTKYKNANFLVFDEDMNSGTTLKFVCDTLQDKLDNSDKQIKCLVNAYSSNGW